MNEVHEARPAVQRRRWLTPVVLVALTALALVVVQTRRDLDWNLRAWLLAAVGGLGLLAQLLWCLLFSRWRWWHRGLVLLAVLAAVAGVKTLTRVEGTVSGTGLPRLVWRWRATADERLARLGSEPLTATRRTVAPELRALQFPQFLGPDRNNRVEGVALARDWTVQPPEELWRRAVGLGWSGFVVSEGLAITQEQRGEEELVTARTLTGGELVWVHTNRTRFREWQGGDGPRATPTLAGDRVYASGGTGILDCLELPTGRLLWSVDVLATHHLDNLTWGKSASPLVADGRVIVSGGTASLHGTQAYRADTGAFLWSDSGDAATYASPSAEVLAGRPQILVNGARAVAGLDPATGRRLWEFAWGLEKAPKCSQPLVVSSNRLFLSAGYSMGCRLLEINPLPDGTCSASEIWHARTLKTQFNNVALRDGHLYGLDDGLLACVEVATGKRLWKDGRYGSGQSLLVNDLILIQSEPGFVALAEARPDGFVELGRLPALSSKTWNNPAVAGPYLLTRNDQEAVCYRLPLAAK